MGIAEKDHWPITTERMIAVMKLTDFENRMTNDHRAFLELMANIISIIKDIEEPISMRVIVNDDQPHDMIGCAVKGIICADSILLISKDSSPAATLHLLGSIMRIQFSLLDLGAALRGGISSGMISASLEDRAFFGEPVNQAYSIADSLLFYGVAEKCIEQTLESMDSIREFGPDDLPLLYPKFAPTLNGSTLFQIVNLSLAFKQIEEVDDRFSSIKPKTRNKEDNVVYNNSIKIYKEAFNYTFNGPKE